MKRSIRFGVFAALVLTCCIARADDPAAAASEDLSFRNVSSAWPQPLPTSGVTSAEELEAFVDGFVAGAFEANRTAGLTISVVRDGALFFAKGYGYADVEHRISVEADKTLFRPGSISKLFTWTAVMQLAEQGKLDLDADVNNYLTQFKIPATYAEPITLRSILTHSAGFEDGALGYLFKRSAEALTPLQQALHEHMPARVRPVGGVTAGLSSAYSNWSTALAGLIVANTSGMSFDDYIERNILEPLDMTSSTFSEPLPAALAKRMSEGYSVEAGLLKAQGFEFIHGFGPAGSMSATATDLANFMIAHLRRGKFGDERILNDDTVQMMHARAFSPNPFVNGSGLGFYETYVNGRRLIGHGGDTLYFHSQLVLIPELDTGFFVSVNTANGAQIPTDFIRAFMDHYFPARLPVIESIEGFAERAAEYAGSYRTNRRNFSSNEKLLALFGGTKVAPTGEGTLMVTSYDETQQFAEIAPGVFRQVDGDTVISFVRGASNKVTGMVGDFAFMAADKLSWYQTSTFHFVLLAVCGVIFIALIVSALRKWKADKAGPKFARWARRNLGLLSLINLAFLLSVIVIFGGDTDDLVFDIPASLYAALALPLIGLLPTLAALVLGAIVWRDRYWTLWGRIRHGAGIAAALAFVWFLAYWNLIGFQFG